MVCTATRSRFVPLLALVALLVSATALAQARSFAVGGSNNRIRFTSDAPLETMVGTSSSVSGSFTIDPANLATARGEIEVPITSLRTGIDLRDHHLRSDTWLDASRYPTARFELIGVSGASSLSPGREQRLTLRGRFTLHGRTHDVSAEARATWFADASGAGGNSITVRARFTVRLTDYGVSVPEVVRLKVANEIVVDVRITGTAG